MQKRNLISMEDALSRYSLVEDSLYSTVSLFKKKYGYLPKWYIQDEFDSVMIDTIEYERLANIEKRAWLQNTNDIYFILTYDFKLTDTQIARFLTRHSKKFTNFASWSSFISKALFSLPRESVIQKKFSMNLEFLVTGTYLIKILLQEEHSNAYNF